MTTLAQIGENLQSLARALNQPRCGCCKARIKMMCAIGTGFCSAQCRRGTCVHVRTEAVIGR